MLRSASSSIAAPVLRAGTTDRAPVFCGLLAEAFVGVWPLSYASGGAVVL